MEKKALAGLFESDFDMVFVTTASAVVVDGIDIVPGKAKLWR